MYTQQASKIMRLPLRRSHKRMIAGVAHGLSEHLRISIFATRLFFIVTSFFFGFGVFLYIWLWVFTPSHATHTLLTSQENTVDTARGEDSKSTKAISAFRIDLLLSVLGLTALFLLSPLLDFSTRRGLAFIGWIVPTVFVTLAVFWKVFMTQNVQEPFQLGKPKPFVDRFANIFVIWIIPVLIFVITLFVMTNMIWMNSNPMNAFWLALLSFYFLLLPISATVYETFRRKIAEREYASRHQERSQMAAHLHDSVLQTLALIQTRTEPHSEISRLARAQERDLREWLFGAENLAPRDMQTELEETVKLLEAEYATEIDLIFVGSLQIPEHQLSDILAATKEAMLNAARHAGGTISVYIEGTTRHTDIFVRDRGGGFVPEALPDNRFGVRESIIARIERLGGSAKISSSPEGTQVQLSIPKVKRTP